MSSLKAELTAKEAHARVVEDALGDHGAAHDGPEGEPQQGDDGDDRVAQRVDVEDPSGPVPLACCRPHEVLGHGLHHGRPHVTAEGGDADGGQGEDRQHQPPRIGENADDGRALGGLGREDREVDREPQDEQRAQQECRHGVEDERQAGDDVVLGLVAPHDLVHAQGDRHDEGEQGGQTHQDQGLRKRLADERADGLVQRVGTAQVEVRQVPEVVQELVPQREIEPVLLVELCDRHRLGLGAEHRPCLPTGDQVDEEEHEGDHPDDHDDGLEKPPDEEAGHGPMLGTLRVLTSIRDRPLSSSDGLAMTSRSTSTRGRGWRRGSGVQHPGACSSPR